MVLPKPFLNSLFLNEGLDFSQIFFRPKFDLRNLEIIYMKQDCFCSFFNVPYLGVLFYLSTAYWYMYIVLYVQEVVTHLI